MSDALTITREWFELLEGLPTVQNRWNVLYAVSRFSFDNVEPDGLDALEKSVFMNIKPAIQNRKYVANNYAKRKNKTLESHLESHLESNLESKGKTLESHLESNGENSSRYNNRDLSNYPPSENMFSLSPTDEKPSKRQVFKVPTLEEVKAYIRGKGYSVDPEEFFSFYESQGWHVGKNKMRDWHRAVSYWQCRINNRFKTKTQLRDYSGI